MKSVLLKFAKRRFTNALLSLRIKGSVSRGSNPTVNFFATANSLSPRLSHLHLVQVNLTNVPVDALPGSLVSLAITESFLPFRWFQRLSESSTAVMPRLKELDLSGSSKTSDADLSCIARAWPELRVLKLNRCYRTTAEGLQSTAEGLRQLEVLEAGGTDCNGVAVHHICRNLAATLRRLSVAKCPLFTDGCAGTVATMLTNLQSLDVSKCAQLSNDALLSFSQLNLQHLDVSATAITNDTLVQLKNALPECNVVYEA